MVALRFEEGGSFLKFIHVSYTGKTGKPVGLFGACWHLKQAGELSDKEVQLLEDMDAWYDEHLPNPPFYDDGNPQKAITWFKDTPKARQLAERLSHLTRLLDKYEVPYTESQTSDPSTIIYEDEYQVAVADSPSEALGLLELSAD